MARIAAMTIKTTRNILLVLLALLSIGVLFGGGVLIIFIKKKLIDSRNNFVE